MSQFVNTYVTFFFLLTPFWVVSTFLSMTRNLDLRARQRLAVRVTIAVIVACLVLFVAGNYLFSVFGITLDSFRIGTGLLLFLAAVSLVYGRNGTQTPDPHEDIAVVPLAIPVTVGPATTGALLVMGVGLENWQERVVGGLALCLAILSVGGLLYVAGAVERYLGQKGLSVLSKLTGLILAALSAQIVMTGVKGMFAGW